MSTQKRLIEAIEDYLAFRRARLAEATAKNERFVLRRFGDWYGDVQIRTMRAERVSDWFFGPNGLRQEHVTRDGQHRAPVAATTANYYRTRLAGFFRWATKKGWLREDLLIDVEAIRAITRTRLRAGPEQLLRLPTFALNPRDRGFLSLAVNTGFRARTAVHIKVGDLDLPASSVRVYISKSGLEDIFPVSADLKPELEAWLRRYALDLGRPLTKADYLFPANKGSVYRWQTNADGSKERLRTLGGWKPSHPMTHPERVVQHALRAIGLPTKGEGVHTIRRSVARAYFDSMAKDGYDHALRTTAAMLHHQSTATTEHYLGMSSERLRRDDALRNKPFLSAMVADQPRATLYALDG